MPGLPSPPDSKRSPDAQMRSEHVARSDSEAATPVSDSGCTGSAVTFTAEAGDACKRRDDTGATVQVKTVDSGGQG